MICALLRDFRGHGQKPIAKVRQTQPATYLKIALLVPKGDENEHTNSLSSGDDPKQSVVDKFERSHDHKNLYLVGRSTFPTGATANPTLTLAALSLQTARQSSILLPEMSIRSPYRA